VVLNLLRRRFNGQDSRGKEEK